ncbi:hypothetical protein [Caballeronia sp. HLA56]
MFDPFGDYETAGYLRNIERIKDLDELKYQEHGFFEANLEKALTFLRSVRGDIAYEHFLEVHGILFDEFYPWAGKDRYSLGVARLVGKGQRIQFEASEQCQRAVEWGLDIGNHPLKMREAPGTVMGAFAWAHPPGRIRFSTETAAPCCSFMPSFVTGPISRSTGAHRVKKPIWKRSQRKSRARRTSISIAISRR